MQVKKKARKGGIKRKTCQVQRYCVADPMSPRSFDFIYFYFVLHRKRKSYLIWFLFVGGENKKKERKKADKRGTWYLSKRQAKEENNPKNVYIYIYIYVSVRKKKTKKRELKKWQLSLKQKRKENWPIPRLKAMRTLMALSAAVADEWTSAAETNIVSKSKK